MTAVVNGKIILPDDNGNFFIANDRVLTFGENIVDIGTSTSADNIIDAQNNFVAPGFINIHIHGCAGADVMDAAPAALSAMRKFLPSTGVTSFLPTTMTMSVDAITAALNNVRTQMRVDVGAKIIGVNLEGPFISEKYCGAQDKKNIRRADFNLFSEFADVIKIITIAPEVVDCDFIDRCRENNIIAAIGHSAADYDTAMAAIQRGASHITHLFNAQSGLHHRNPNIVGAGLDSHAIVEIIADNVHIHPAVQRIVWNCKNHSEIILITDSFRACGLGDGESELGGQKVIVENGVAKLENGTIAASIAPMNAVVRNFRQNTNANIAEVVELVTKNPAREFGIYDRVGSLEIGKAADIVIFDDDINIIGAIVNGNIV